MFHGRRGPRRRLNGQPIHASQVAGLSDALAVCSFPPSVRRDSPDLLLFLEMVGCTQGIRRTGSSALNLCYVAAGRFDLYWSYSTNIWDVAAGVLLLREAGGYVTSPTGGEFRLEEAHFLAAANQELHAQLRGGGGNYHGRRRVRGTTISIDTGGSRTTRRDDYPALGGVSYQFPWPHALSATSPK